MMKFDIVRDLEIVNAGGFFCKACCVGKPTTEQSPDPRYCQGCYDYLLKEAEYLSAGKKPGWVPRQDAASRQPEPEKRVTKIIQVPLRGDGIMLHEKRRPGRPNKPDGEPVCRMTEYRRRKQAVLL